MYSLLFNISLGALSRALTLVPSRVRKATVPLQMGLRIMRMATWAATITLSAIYLRRVCYLMADTSISTLNRYLPFSARFRSTALR